MKDAGLPADRRQRLWPPETGQAGLTNTKVISNNISDIINEIKHQAGKEILLFVARQ